MHRYNIWLCLTLCILETPKQVLLQIVKTEMKYSIMLHFIRVYTGCTGKKDHQTKEYNIFFLNNDLTPLDMCNGLSQVWKDESISIQSVKSWSDDHCPMIPYLPKIFKHLNSFFASSNFCHLLIAFATVWTQIRTDKTFCCKILVG